MILFLGGLSLLVVGYFTYGRRVTDEKVVRQKARLLRCVGTWKDDRSTQEIIADIESHRTMGRAVDL